MQHVPRIRVFFSTYKLLFRTFTPNPNPAIKNHFALSVFTRYQTTALSVPSYPICTPPNVLGTPLSRLEALRFVVEPLFTCKLTALDTCILIKHNRAIKTKQHSRNSTSSQQSTESSHNSTLFITCTSEQQR